MSDSVDHFATLLKRALAGNVDAMDQLLLRHRDRLKSMVMVHMDSRLASRFDASDVVQDTLLTAAQRLNQYDPSRVSFYIWLRQIARDRLSELYQRHVGTKKRSVLREHAWGLSQDSTDRLAVRFTIPTEAILDQVIRRERQQRLQIALARLPEQQREILVMRHLEQLSMAEIAAACELTEGAVKMRQLRAVRRLRRLLELESSSSR
ncbi:MAG: sigma-70 family RNA polymerase sigma factor [Phycisphaera sp. RhM]|nr:sigma-70 family RNA polymerase sigma factor [Phycisphaera sp. RhM]